MIVRRLGILAALVLVAVLVLANWDSAEERAEQRYASGLELLEAGDVDRALVEFRNVFRLNGHHREARRTYARLLRERGEAQDAYGHYLRLVEQYPDDLDGLVALSEMAVLGGLWDDAERHGRAAMAVDPDDPAVTAIAAALDYRAAVVAEDAEAIARAEEAARLVVEAAPGNPVARRVLIDARIVARDWEDAILQIDAAIEAQPDELSLHELKLRTLAEMDDQDAIGAHLQEMFTRFPNNENVRNLLVAWYTENDAIDEAEALLRSMTEDEDPARALEAKVGVVQFLAQVRGPDAARAELDRLLAEGEDTATWHHLRAGIDFDQGDTEGAIAALEEVLADAPPSDETNGIKVTLARMLATTGNEVGARARIAEVLTSDPTYVQALQMQAAWLIGDDRPGEAIATLRTALEQDPRSPETLSLMAEAHLREGSKELAAERLALAVEASGQRAAESLRYAEFLAGDGRLLPAESVLIDALRRDPVNLDLLRALGDVYLRLEDWPRVEGVIDRLEEIGSGEAEVVVNYLEVTLLYRQDRIDESVAMLERLIAEGDASVEAASGVVRAHLQTDRPDEAAAYLDSLLAENPENPNLRLMRAGVHAIQGEADQAEETYRALLAESPDNAEAILALYRLLRANDEPEEAAAVLDEGLAATEQAAGLMFLRAGELEATEDFEGAIAVYEELYSRDTGNAVLANNLASLLSTHRDDAESLERAFVVSRRLKPLEVPAFQDTYGWIEYRRGNHEEAVAYLEPAAAGLPDDPMVQLHLGLAYAALNRTEDARRQIALALEIAGDSDLPQFEEGRRVLAGLGGGEAAGAGAPDTPDEPDEPDEPDGGL